MFLISTPVTSSLAPWAVSPPCVTPVLSAADFPLVEKLLHLCPGATWACQGWAAQGEPPSLGLHFQSEMWQSPREKSIKTKKSAGMDCLLFNSTVTFVWREGKGEMIAGCTCENKHSFFNCFHCFLPKVRAAFKHKTKVWSLTSSSTRNINVKPFNSDIVSIAPFPPTVLESVSHKFCWKEQSRPMGIFRAA